MLSTVTAAETLFRHDTATRARELAFLRSLQERREAIAESMTHSPTTRRAAVAWPRPIGVKLDTAAAVCA